MRGHPIRQLALLWWDVGSKKAEYAYSEILAVLKFTGTVSASTAKLRVGTTYTTFSTLSWLPVTLSSNACVSQLGKMSARSPRLLLASGSSAYSWYSTASGGCGRVGREK